MPSDLTGIQHSQNKGTFLPCEGFSTSLHCQRMVGSICRCKMRARRTAMLSSAAAVGFGTGHCKLGAGQEPPPSLGCRGKGFLLWLGLGKTSHAVPRRQIPPQFWGKMCPRQQEKQQFSTRAAGTVAGAMSSSMSRGWWAEVAETDSGTIQNLS